MQENKILVGIKMFRKAFGSYKYRIVLLIITGFLSGLMEGIGINTIIPLFSFVVKNQDKPTDIVSRSIESFFVFFNIPYQLKYLIVLIAILFIIKAIMTFSMNYITEKIRSDYVKNARNKLFSMTLESNWSYLSKQKIGYLEKVIMNDINFYSAMLTYSSSTVILIINVLIYVFISFNVSPTVTILTVGLGSVFFILFKPIMDRVRMVSHETSIAQKHLANHVNESMIGIKTIKAMGIEQEVANRGNESFEKLRSSEMKLSVYTNFTYVITQPFSIIIILSVFAYSYKLTNFSFASFAVIVYSINKILTYIQDGQARLQNINSLYPYLKSVVEYEEKAIINREPYQGKDGVQFKDKIELKDINFSYNGEKNVLDNLNLEIKKGEMIGIIGPSGSGKTTLVDMLLSLIEPSSGEILVDGKKLENIKNKDWRKHIGYVSQDIFLLNDTIENNIKLYNSSITDETMVSSAKIAHIYDFIKNLPKKFESIAGERGMELSGGQRQRIALARVLARKPQILILDEATSALDNESEASIQEAIEELRGHITMIIIAHRPTTVANTDKLVVIKDGKIIEQGSPKELLENDNSYYSNMYKTKIK